MVLLGVAYLKRLSKPLLLLLSIVVAAFLSDSIGFLILMNKRENVWVANYYIFIEFTLYVLFTCTFFPDLQEFYVRLGAIVTMAVAAFLGQPYSASAFNDKGYSVMTLYIVIMMLILLFRQIQEPQQDIGKAYFLAILSTLLYFVAQFPLYAANNLLVSHYREIAAQLHLIILTVTNVLHYGIIGIVLVLYGRSLENQGVTH